MVPPADPEAWRRASDRASDAVLILDREARVVLLNATAERRGGVTAAEAVGREIGQVFPAAAGSEREAAVRRVLAGGPAELLRMRHPSFGIWVEIEIVPDPLGVMIVVRDVERVVELERRTRLESAILDSVGEGIYGVDANNKITFMNAAAERLLGYAAATLTGIDAHEALHHTQADGTTPYRDADCPLAQTLRDGQPRDATDVLWRADRTPLTVEYHAAPIEQDGVITGAVVSFRDLTERLAAEQARTAAQAAEDALHELQQVLQPPPPKTRDPLLGIHYLPADAAGAGGDLYDWQQLPEDGMHLAVVDVVGKGLTAARDALAVTHALRLLVLAGTPLEQVVKQASWLLADAYPELAATAVLARYEPRSGRLRFVSAGHPPPLLLRPDGSNAFLDASGRPLGWPDAGTDDVVEITLEPGARVVLYTDGLIEARKDVTEGMSALTALADRLRTVDVTEAARHLVEDTLASAARRDDCLALVLERPEPR